MKYCVIMCGGVGSRFWPFSRTVKPKQFLDFFGSGLSLLQATYERVLPVVDPERILLLTNSQYYDIVREQLPEVSERNILLEPARRNTAPCICWAAHHILALDPDASIVTLPSDHLILKERSFHEALRKGFDFVEKGDRLLTLGIKPSSPHTGYGYIQLGRVTEEDDTILKVKSFTEKPAEDMANLFLKSGEFFWNSGIFLWRADSIIRAFDQYEPEIGGIFDAGKAYYGTPEEKQFIEENFPSAPSVSIDYAVMEKASNVYVETVDLGWSDLGSWKALYESSPRNRDGNVTQNCRILASNCYDTVFAVKGDKIVVADGLRDYIVADNKNALLIFPKEKEQELRHVVNDIKTRFGDKYI